MPMNRFRMSLDQVTRQSKRPVIHPFLLMGWLVFFSFFGLLSLFGSPISEPCGKIIYPRNAITAIVKAGESFDIWLMAEPGQVVTSLVLKGPYNTVEIDSESITSLSGQWEYDPVSGNTYNTQMTVTVPTGVPEDRYDLILTTSCGDVTSHRSVRVIREYKPAYKIFVMADSHLGQRGNEVLIANKHTAFVTIANIINPDIVLNAGDVTNHHADSARLQGIMDLFYHGNESEGWLGMSHFNAATFVLAGNHDYPEGREDGLPNLGYYDLKSDYWNRWHGLQYHFFGYGNSRFMLFNNGWLGYDWLWQTERAADWLRGDGAGGHFNVAMAHISRTEYMGSFARNHDVGLYLLGHNHNLGDRNPYRLNDRFIMYYARAIVKYMEFLLFQVDDKLGAYTPLGDANTDPDTAGYGLSTANNRILANDEERNNPDPSVWVYNLTLDYQYENNGTPAYNVATFVNKFDYAIPAARVRFVMPKGRVYHVSKGAIYQSFDGDVFHIVDVDVDLNANSTTVVEIKAES